MKYYKNIICKIKNYFYKNFILIKEVKLLKKELKEGLFSDLNIQIAFILLNIYLLLPNTYIDKLYKKSNNQSSNKVIGLIIFRKNVFYKKKIFHLDLIVVDSQYKRKGIGSEMINNMTKFIREYFNNLSIVFIYLKTLKYNNNIGNKFYKKNKFDLLYSNNKYNVYYKKLEFVINN